MTTLGVYRTLFWAAYDNWMMRMLRDKYVAGLAESKIPKQAVNDYLNLGWAHVAEDLGCMTARFVGPIVSGQAEYVIENSENIWRVDKIELQQNGKTRAIITPQVSKSLALDVDEMVSGLPAYGSVSLAKHENSPAEMELLLQPPPNWDDDDGIWLFCYMRPDSLVNDSDTPEFPLQSMGEAGMNYALYVATGDNQFYNRYLESLEPYRKSGLGTKSTFKNSHTYRRVSALNINSISAGG